MAEEQPKAESVPATRMGEHWIDRLFTIEGLSATMGIWWGLWLINPYFDTFGTTPIYDGMAKVAPEWIWGLLMVLLGIALLYCLLARRMEYAPFALMGLGAIWLVILGTFLKSGFQTTAIPIYGTMTLFSFGTLFRYYRNGHDRSDKTST